MKKNLVKGPKSNNAMVMTETLCDANLTLRHAVHTFSREAVVIRP